MSKTIMLIHGAWLTPAGWEPFKTRFETQGYKVIAPAWPYDDRPVAELKRSPHPEHSKSPAVTAFKLFPRRSHFLCAEPGWEEVADYAITWASQHAKARN